MYDSLVEYVAKCSVVIPPRELFPRRPSAGRRPLWALPADDLWPPTMGRGSAPSAVPPKHSISAQRAALRLEDYEKELAKTLLPREDPVEAFYKPVDPQAHTYNPKPPVRPGMPVNGSPSAAARLRVPKMLRQYDPNYSQHSELDVAQVAPAPTPPRASLTPPRALALTPN